MEVTYDLIDLHDQDPASFEATLSRCAEEGFWGVNVTYPFKERAAKVVGIPAATVRQIGSVNTVVFGGSLPGQGYNTDYSGFLRAYQQRFPQQSPRVVGLVGAGGVGKAVACGLAELGASALRIYDLDRSKAQAVADLIRRIRPQVVVHICTDV